MKRFLYCLWLILLGSGFSTTDAICQKNITALLDSAENLQESNPLKALEYAELAERKSLLENNKLLHSRANFQIGKIYRILGKLATAEEYLNVALENKAISSEIMVDIYNEMGIILKQQCRFDEALVYYEETLAIQQKLENKKGEARAYNNIGRIYELLEEYTKAMLYYHKALLIYEKLPITKSTAITLQNKGNIYRALNNNDSALICYNQALKIYQSIGNELLSAYAYNSIASVTTDKDVAISYLNKSIEMQKSLNAEADLGNSYVELAEIYFDDNQYAKAIPYLENGYKLFAVTGHKNSTRDALGHLYRAYENMGDYESALRYHILFTLYQDSVKSENNFYAIQKYESELKLKDKEVKIAIQDNEIKSSNEKLRIKRIQSVYFIAGVIVLSFLLIVVLYQVIRLKKFNSLLNIQKSKIERSDKEKEILIREVHHRVKNNLQIISSLFTIEQRKTESSEVKSALTYAKQRIEAMSLIHEKLYKQSDLSNINLEDYLYEICENLLDSFDRLRSINIDVRSDVESIDTDSAINIGLVVTELMTNSIKHGFSTDCKDCKIGISLRQKGELISFGYEDNGIGVAPDFDLSQSQNFGHRLIISIVKKLKGEIIEDNNSHQGFRFLFDFKDLRYV
jgi:two-component sensor histidine kinase